MSPAHPAYALQPRPGPPDALAKPRRQQIHTDLAGTHLIDFRTQTYATIDPDTGVILADGKLKDLSTWSWT
jgi:hypothetical protein